MYAGDTDSWENRNFNPFFFFVPKFKAVFLYTHPHSIDQRTTAIYIYERKLITTYIMFSSDFMP